VTVAAAVRSDGDGDGDADGGERIPPMIDRVYSERPSVFAGSVVWTQAARTAPAAQSPTSSSRILPDGCMDLIWSDGRLLVAGPDTSAVVMPPGSGASYTGLRFAPGLAPSVLGVPGRVLRDARVDLDVLWPAAEVRRVTDQVASAPDPGAALEAVVRQRLGGLGPTTSWTVVAVRRLRAGSSVAAVAGSVGYSERHLHRLSLDAFGYGLKTLARVLRLTRALDLARAGGELASVAVAAGYADQPHFAREVKALAGVSITDLLPERSG
jgi:AraC-like DNA-binding protein